MQNQVFNLSALPKEAQDLIEVEKAAAYAVWKERTGALAKAEEDIKDVALEYKDHFFSSLSKYRGIKA